MGFIHIIKWQFSEEVGTMECGHDFQPVSPSIRKSCRFSLVKGVVSLSNLPGHMATEPSMPTCHAVASRAQLLPQGLYIGCPECSVPTYLHSNSQFLTCPHGSENVH